MRDEYQREPKFSPEVEEVGDRMLHLAAEAKLDSVELTVVSLAIAANFAAASGIAEFEFLKTCRRVFRNRKKLLHFELGERPLEEPKSEATTEG